MKKTLITLMISATTSPAFAMGNSGNSEAMFDFKPMQAEQFSVQGSLGLGGYYDTATKAIYDDWATALTIAVNYENNRLLGYVEVDLEFNYATNTKKVSDRYQLLYGIPFKSHPITDVDKAWIGYKTDYGVISYGWKNDTALDAVDGAGDFTYEFGSSAPDGDDGFHVVKFVGETQGVAYGISYFETSDDLLFEAEKGINGYVGYQHDMFNIYVGYEHRLNIDWNRIDPNLWTESKLLALQGDSSHLYTVTGNVSITDKLTVGANVWLDQTSYKYSYITLDRLGYYVSAGYQINDMFSIAAGYTDQWQKVTDKNDVTMSAVNVAAVYTPADHLEFGIDVKQELDTGSKTVGEETSVFAVGYYYF